MKHLQLGAFALALTLAGAAAADEQQLMVRGNYLVNSMVACGNCHVARGPQGQPLMDKGLSGGMPFEDPMFMAYAPNITPDKETGIGNWTKAQLAKAIREGIRPDGTVIGPPMPIPFYRQMADEDLEAIVTYIMAQPPVHNQVPKSTYKMTLPPNYGPPVKDIAAPPPSDTVNYGKYLVTIAHCFECHTPRKKDGMLDMTRMGAGGQEFPGPWGVSVSRNLTPDKDGLKNWTDAQIATAIREGIDSKGAHLKPPMAFGWYKNINDADMAAMIAYLRSIPPQPSNGK